LGLPLPTAKHALVIAAIGAHFSVINIFLASSRLAQIIASCMAVVREGAA